MIKQQKIKKQNNFQKKAQLNKTTFHYSGSLKLTAFGGVDNVTKNMFIYEFGNDIVVVDCGIGFPDEPSESNKDLIIPDFSYLLKNKDKIRGLVVSHAHFDHYGAVPYLLEKIRIPIYCSRLTQEFIKAKAKETGIKPDSIDFHSLSGNDRKIRLGSFQLTPFHVNHSVPQTLGFFISTPVGNFFHVSDHKFDWTPVDEDPFDIQKASSLASIKKPIFLISDCLGAAKPGHTSSESNIQEVLENIMIRSKGLVLTTTVSSNISRIKQSIQAASNVGRKSAFVGRSLEQSYEIAKNLGYFSNLKQFIIPARKIKSYPYSKLNIIVAGSYGQSDSSLARVSKGKHNLVRLRKDDLVIFCADPGPPGVIVDVNKMIDNLTKLGARVYYYEIQDDLHASGHGTGEDIKMLFALTKPKYLIPIGGDFRHMRAYQLLAAKMGYSEDKVLFLTENKSIEFSAKGEVIVK